MNTLGLDVIYNQTFYLLFPPGGGIVPPPSHQQILTDTSGTPLGDTTGDLLTDTGSP